MSNNIARFPDAEQVVCTALAELAAVPVHTRIPKPRPAAFVRVIRTGGVSRQKVADAAILTVECWAQTPSAAAQLAAQTRAQVHSLAGHVVSDTTIGRVGDVAGPQNLPDPVSDQPRYTFAVEMLLRGTPFPPGS